MKDEEEEKSQTLNEDDDDETRKFKCFSCFEHVIGFNKAVTYYVSNRKNTLKKNLQLILLISMNVGQIYFIEQEVAVFVFKN